MTLSNPITRVLFLLIANGSAVFGCSGASKQAAGSAFSSNESRGRDANNDATGPLPLTPLASAGPDLVVARGTQVRLDGRQSRHPSDEPLTFRWTQIAGDSPVTLSNPSSNLATFVAPATTQTLRFRLRAQTNVSDFADDEMTVEVVDVVTKKTPYLSAPRDVDVVPTQSVSVRARLVAGLSVGVPAPSIGFTIVAGVTGTVTATDDDQITLIAPSAITVIASQANLDGLDTGPTFTVLRPPAEPLEARSTGGQPAPAQTPGFGAPPSELVATIVAPGTRVVLERSVRGTWRQLVGELVTLTEENSTRSRFDAPRQVGTLVFEFTPDIAGGGEPDFVLFEVEDTALAASMIVIGSDLVTHPLNVVVLDASESELSAGVTPVWEQTLGTSVTLLDSLTLTPNFSAPETVSELCFTLRLRTTDGDSKRTSVVVRVRPTTLNDAPIATLSAEETSDDIFDLIAVDRDPERDDLASRQWSTLVAGVTFTTPSQSTTSVNTTAAASRPVTVSYRVCDVLDACSTTDLLLE